VRKRWEALDLDQEQGKELAACLTAVQALSRPLKLGESRGLLCKKCQSVLSAKGMKLPAALQSLLDKLAGGAATGQ
jgi:hypothetical protein